MRKIEQRRERARVVADDRTRAVVLLNDERARDATTVGAKAAALAIAGANGLPVLPGAVLTTVGAPATEIRAVWGALSDSGRLPLAVRSSSTAEDQVATSMAGQFTTVLDVEGWDETVDAIARVRASSRGAPMGVLLQPMCDAALGGVLFGVDPVTGQRDRVVIEVVDGTPNALVSGAVSATRIVLTRRGRVIEQHGDVELSRADLVRLRHLARDTARVFGAPQDIEWAIDRAGRLWLLQSRPVTAIGATATGPRFGPGPVAETFPDALAPLEVDLWVEPLRAGIAEALRLAAAHPARLLASSPVLVDIGGRVAADLDLLEGRPRSRFVSLVDPRPPARRLASSWRVGRLRAALPLLAGDLVAAVDRELAAIPRVDLLDDSELLALVGRCRLALRAVHGHEVLAGVLTDDDGPAGVALALRAVAAGRARGLSDDEIVGRSPIALALLPPAVGASPSFPVVGSLAGSDGILGARESLRLRARWLQELSARAASMLGERLARSGCLSDPLAVRWLTLDELVSVVRDGAEVPLELIERIAVDPPPPLPAAFRLTHDGAIVVEPTASTGAGRGAGGGRGVGTVAGPHDAPVGTVLVVRTLEPGLAARLPGRAGLVAETGSVLSHLAIVARELGVPTVVGVPDALDRFPPGTRVVVDGRTGDVEVVS